MSNWNFSKPNDSEPGEHAYALVVFIGEGKEVGVRCLERAEIIKSWGSHVFGWQPMSYPSYSIDDIGKVVDDYRKIPIEASC